MFRWQVFPLLFIRVGGAILRLFGIMLGLVVIAVTVGLAMPAATLNLDAGDCDQPCWQDFILGVTTYEAAVAAVQDRGLANPDTVQMDEQTAAAWRSTLSWETRLGLDFRVRMRFTSGVLDQIDLFPGEPLYLREIFSVFGPPTHASCQSSFGNFSVQLYFFDGVVEVWAIQEDFEAQPAAWQVAPDIRVSRIAYRQHLAATQGAGAIAAYPWQGFARVGNKGYCR